MENPLVSIIIVTFNAGKTLQRALDSIFEQSYQNIELIIIDGLSTDNTVDIIKRNDEKIFFWLSEKDSGVYDAMNKALKFVKGDRICFLGADDYLLKGFSLMINQLKEEETIYLGAVRFNGKLLGRGINSYSLTKGNLIHQGLLYPKSVFKKFRYKLIYAIYADYYLNIQCYKFYRFRYLNIPVVDFSDGGLSSKYLDLNFIKNKNLIIHKYLSKLTYCKFLLRQYRKNLS